MVCCGYFLIATRMPGEVVVAACDFKWLRFKMVFPVSFYKTMLNLLKQIFRSLILYVVYTFWVFLVIQPAFESELLYTNLRSQNDEIQG